MVQKSWWWKQKYLFLSKVLAVPRPSRNQIKPVWAETVKKYSTRKLELLSPHNWYIGHQWGIWKIMGKDFWWKGLSWFNFLSKRYRLGKICLFSNTCQLFSFLTKLNFLKDYFTTTHICWIFFFYFFTYIWSFSLCKITQLQESEMRPTGWTPS